MNGKNYTSNDFAYHSENGIMLEIATMLRRMVDNQSLYSGGRAWQVVRANQPTIQALQENTIYFDVISKRRVGTQSSMKSVKVDGKWQRGTQWIEEWMVQVSAFRPRKPEDNSSTLTSADVITKLQACVNGGGWPPYYNGGVVAAWLTQDWMQIIKSSSLREIDFETDSGLKEKLPQFDFTLVIRQGLLANLGTVDKVEVKTKMV